MNNTEMIAFSNLLRDKGVNVSIRSTQTACIVWNLINKKSTIDELKSAVYSVYIKDKVDDRKFNEAFNQLFILKNQYQNIQSEQKKSRYNLSDQNTQQQEETSTLQQNNPKNNKKGNPKDQEHKRVSDNSIVNERLIDLKEDKRLFEICYKLGLKIANQRIARKKREQSYEINMPFTIRSNIKYGGKLLNIKTTKKPKRKSKHFFLVDVSGSCDWINNWFFAIIYGCQRSFDKVKIYDFDNKIVEMTEAFNAESYNEAYDIIRNRRYQHGMMHGRSDMTKSFKDFQKDAVLTHRSNVIILTDCRDWTGKREDGQLESASILKQISKQSKKVVIFNPEGKIRWNNPTSCVRDYQQVGAQMHEVGTLDHLSRLITRL